jgi:sec-independent protein translocase protein TatA
MYTLANINNPMLWVAILVVVVVLFGGQKIPELMKGLGQGKRAFEEGLRTPPVDDELRKEQEREAEIRRRVEEEMRKGK